ncbi:MAG TPA: penicillin-binding protein 2 [Candidatus Moranbacteria bacterium]|nr:penicillin-binding protein 2 [Candidatus Moranbacteria bacterium]
MFNRNKSKAYSGMEIEDYVLTATEKEAAKMERPLKKKWFDFLWWIIIAGMLVLAARVFFLTVIKGPYYQDISKGNSIRSIVINAPRGRIFDRTGKVLVNNIPSMDAVIIPAYLPRDEQKIKEMSAEIANILKMNKEEIQEKIEKSISSSLNSVLLKENISQDESLILLEKNNYLQGIDIEKTAIRSYSDGLIFSHILGYEGKITKEELESNKGYLLTDYIGKEGIEKSYEQYLRGVHGATQVEVDSMGNIKREIGIINPKTGNDLILGIDSDLQKKIYDSLNDVMLKTQTKTSAAVAINPQNGEIMAMVSIPSYDNNLFAQKISSADYANLINDSNKPLFNRAIAGEYPPGSTIKPIIASAALSEGTITPETIIDGLGGRLYIGNYSFGDWKAHGPSDVRTAIAESNDIFFYTIGGGYSAIRGLGMDKMKKWYNLYGLGQLTGVDIGGEKKGLIPDEQWKLDKFGEKWTIGNSYHAAIGQGFISATPIQLANYTAAIANGGKIFKPHFVSKIKKNDNSLLSIQPQIMNSNVVSPEIISVIREGMRKVVTDGTAQTLKDMSIEIAGKTGTAQFGTGNQTHGWFTSFAPYENPQIAMVVLVEGGGEGHSSALPVTKEVYDWYFNR